MKYLYNMQEGEGPACETPQAEPHERRRALALLYRFEGHEAKRLKRAHLYSSYVSAGEIENLLHADGVDLRCYRVRVYDEQFQGWMMLEDDIELDVRSLRMNPAALVPT